MTTHFCIPFISRGCHSLC